MRELDLHCNKSILLLVVLLLSQVRLLHSSDNVTTATKPSRNLPLLRPDTTLTPRCLLNGTSCNVSKRLWRWTSSDSPQYARPEYDDTQWQQLSPEFSADSLHNWTGIAWLRIVVSVSSAFADNQSFAVTMRHWGASEVYADGVRVAAFGRVSASAQEEQTYNPNQQPFSIPLKPGSTHVIAVRYSNTQAASLHNKLLNWIPDDGFSFAISDAAATNNSYMQEQTRAALVYMTVLAVVSILSLLQLALYAATKETSAVLLAIISFAIGFVAMVDYNFEHLHLSSTEAVWLTTVQMFLVFTTVALLLLAFCHSTFRQHVPSRLWWMYTPLSVLAFGISLLGNVALIYAAVACNFLLIVPETSLLIAKGFRRYTAEAVLMIVSIATMITAAVIMSVVRGSDVHASVVGYSAVFILTYLSLPVGMSFLTVLRFWRTHIELARRTEENERLTMAVIQKERERQALIENRNQELEAVVELRTRELQHYAALLETSNQELARQLGVSTEQAQHIEITNAQLQETNIKLDEANRSKTKILSIVSHDLKNPLNNIIGYAELLKFSITEQAERDFVEKILQSAQWMLTLVKELLDGAARELGHIMITRERVDYSGLLHNAIIRLQASADRKNQRIVAQIREGCYGMADEHRMLQVVENLLSNAIKYSPEHTTIWVELSQTPDSVRMTFRDEGPGLSEEDKQQAFRFFQRLSAKPTGGEHSTGVGLALAKQIVEAHEGRITVESAKDAGIQGATFIVELPREPVMPKDPMMVHENEAALVSAVHS